ncbi:MAG: GT4 family glycosyltransferase PelF [Actinobacteria bacterium]|nr:GT4 family glycosyltransferase PelF [Actinomycetota bacterium]
MRRIPTARTRVLLLTEGTYPHHRGGVSTWCDRLIRGLPEVDFAVWALTADPGLPPRYELPQNVVDLRTLPVWGTEGFFEYGGRTPTRKVLKLARKTREGDVSQHFLPLLARLMDAIAAPSFDPGSFAVLLTEIRLYFERFDPRTTWRARGVWDLFRDRLVERARAAGPAGDGDSADAPDVPTLWEVREALQSLYRLLGVLAGPIPRADVSHATAAAFCSIPAIVAKVESGTPFLLTEHGVYVKEQMLLLSRRRVGYHVRWVLGELARAVAQTAYAMADQISPVTGFNARWEVALGAPDDRISVIANGVSAEEFRPMPRLEGDEGPAVISLSRIEPFKDLETFVRVADAVRRRVPGVRFLHFGPVVDAEYWERLLGLVRTLGLDGVVRFMGPTSRPAEAINRGDVVLLTSSTEAQPFIVLEAMMCGKPVVATDVGGIRDAVGDTGATARVGDLGGLVEPLVELFEMPADARERLAGAARARAVERFSLDRWLGGYAESYGRLAAGRSTPPEVRWSARAEREAGPALKTELRGVPLTWEEIRPAAPRSVVEVLAWARGRPPSDRLMAVRELAAMSTPEAIGALRRLAAHDPATLVRENALAGVIGFLPERPGPASYPLAPAGGPEARVPREEIEEEGAEAGGTGTS